MDSDRVRVSEAEEEIDRFVEVLDEALENREV